MYKIIFSNIKKLIPNFSTTELIALRENNSICL